MNRWLWLAAGAAAGLAVTLVLRPEAWKTATAFWDDVRDGVREREAELRSALGIDETGDAETGDAETGDAETGHAKTDENAQPAEGATQ